MIKTKSDYTAEGYEIKISGLTRRQCGYIKELAEWIQDHKEKSKRLASEEPAAEWAIEGKNGVVNVYK